MSLTWSERDMVLTRGASFYKWSSYSSVSRYRCCSAKVCLSRPLEEGRFELAFTAKQEISDATASSVAAKLSQVVFTSTQRRQVDSRAALLPKRSEKGFNERRRTLRRYGGRKQEGASRRETETGPLQLHFLRLLAIESPHVDTPWKHRACSRQL